MKSKMLSMYNCRTADVEAVPCLSINEFGNAIIENVRCGARIASLFGIKQSHDSIRLFVVMADDEAAILRLASTVVSDKYPSITVECPQAHLFERQIAEQFGIKPLGHPWLKPVRFSAEGSQAENQIGRAHV